MQRGDTVRCIYPGPYPLTIGKLYEVVARKDRWVTVKGDAGAEATYADVRFEKVKNEPKQADRSAA